MGRGLGTSRCERVLDGAREAFGLLIDRHRESATRFALRILRVRADAEDVVQEAWLSVARRTIGGCWRSP
ncbi:MAG: hypothetical protein DMD87_17965 [Candidatus Rokuibacteriota bacterium]|nr:MAG: hypothetical protein DMD87_17965 [Candidatus Rokubacteria bacterium]